MTLFNINYDKKALKTNERSGNNEVDSQLEMATRAMLASYRECPSKTEKKHYIYQEDEHNSN